MCAMKERLEKLGAWLWLLGPLGVCFSTVLLVSHAAGRPVSAARVVLFAAGVVAAYALDFWADHGAQRRPAVLLLAAFASAAGLAAAWWLPGWKIGLAAALGLVGLTYRQWKKWPLAKTILVAGAWTTASVCFPLQGDARNLLFSPFAGALFALFAANALLCDLKDGEADARAGVRSAVVLWGRPATAAVAAALAITGAIAALAVGWHGLAGAGAALTALAIFPKTLSRPVLGPALADGALTLPALLILLRLA
jgi:hypothetical protein